MKQIMRDLGETDRLVEEINKKDTAEL